MEKKIILWDKPRDLRYDFNAFCDFEAAAGFAFTNLDINKLGLTEIRILIWAGLKHDNPKISFTEVGEIINNTLNAPDTKNTFETICQDINAAIKLSGVFKTDDTGDPDTKK